MYQENIPLERADGTFAYIDAHLVDCRSHGGFSGSPCFFQRYQENIGVKEGVPYGGEVTFLLGLISGHFDDFTNARVRGDIAENGAIQSRINTGVGIVTPAEKIVEVLELPIFKDERERVVREREQKPEEGATLDSVDKQTDRTEFENFEDLARRLIHTQKPKTDADD
jgi:hypothetical protein